jgi:hypothetical protein
MCACCMNSQLTRKARISKSSSNKFIPGEMEKAREIVSPFHVHMALMKGTQTKINNVAAIFIYLQIDITYVHQQNTAKAEESVEGR